MSASRNVRAKKPFCKVCKDAGKSIDIYTNHNIRDAKNKVVCPTLLNQSCYHCAGLGHTPKYCPQRKQEEKNNRRRDYHEKTHYDSHKKRAQQDANAQSYFGVLEEDNNMETKTKKKVVTESVPAVVEPKVQKYANSYANVLKSQKKPSQESTIVVDAPYIKPTVQTCESSLPVVPPVFRPRIKRILNWADDVSDSEDEEDEEYDMYYSE